MTFGIYSDFGYTNPLSTIDFGEIVRPNIPDYHEESVYIRNEGNVTFQLYWNSTLSDVTSELTETWTGFNNGTSINPDQVKTTMYGISIPAYPTVGTYNWTLTIWAEYEY